MDTYILKRILEIRNITILTALLLSLTYSATINIPGDYLTIQAGINAANNGDLIRIADGVYPENLLVEKNITIASHYINNDGSIGGDSSHQTNTIIDGSQSGSNDMLGGCMLVRPSQGSNAINISVYGLTLRSGKGTKVEVNIGTQSNPIYTYRKYGGAIFVYKGGNVTMKYNKFQNNGSISVNKGGALVLSDSDDIDFDDRTYVHSSTSNNRDLFDISNNIFLGNFATIAKSVYLEYSNISVDMTGGDYDVINTSNDYVSQYWIIGRPKDKPKKKVVAPQPPPKKATPKANRKRPKQKAVKKQEWATQVRSMTPVLIRKGFTREGKASSVPQIRNYLKKEKKLRGAELKTSTVLQTVME